jgi:hypothetical protein
VWQMTEDRGPRTASNADIPVGTGRGPRSGLVSRQPRKGGYRSIPVPAIPR